MSTTNHTVNYALSQYIGTDATSYLSNYNSDMYKIDAQMKVNADDAADAKSDAATAVATSTTAASNASAAVSTANAANTTAEAAQTAATAAQTAAGAAQTDAAAALRASASNTIGNLAPAYDSTLTYAVGDLVTYVDPVTNQGKLYKCIVAIATPEAFNINKWDDVTTSEVYAPSENHYDMTTDGTETWGDFYQRLCEWCFANIPFNRFANIHLMRIDGTNITGGLYRVSYSSYYDDNNKQLTFSNVGSDFTKFEVVSLGLSVNAGVVAQLSRNFTVSASDSSVTYTSNPDSIISARTIRIIW